MNYQIQKSDNGSAGFLRFNSNFTVAKGRERVGKPGLQAPGVSHLQDQVWLSRAGSGSCCLTQLQKTHEKL